ncbi:hypothetical protein DRO54_06865 [Candidatus Bathyarchaeota archaeon]|nr:MAG: hypothetical protein DRO54_06865 [Candidatus Bathyarchaeota archaeon]
MERSELPLFIGKVSDKAVVNPSDWVELGKKLGQISEDIGVPKFCLISFFKEAYEWLRPLYNPKVYKLFSFPLYVFRHDETELALTVTEIGAPASTLKLEELIALGAKYLIFFGAVGVLKPNIERGTIILPVKAIRDEGTSFHYQKPSKYAYPSKLLLKAIRRTLRENGVNFIEGVCWTTDAPYRETYRKVRLFEREGCICVDMEASALFSVARYRRRHIAGVFVAGDYVGGKKWAPRMNKSNMTKIEKQRKRLMELAIKSLVKLDKLLLH